MFVVSLSSHFKNCFTYFFQYIFLIKTWALCVTNYLCRVILSTVGYCLVGLFEYLPKWPFKLRQWFYFKLNRMGLILKKKLNMLHFVIIVLPKCTQHIVLLELLRGGGEKNRKQEQSIQFGFAFRTRRYVPNEPSTGNDAISLIERRVTFGRYYKLNRATLWRWVYVTMSTTNTNIEENRINLSVVMNMTSLLYSTNEIEILKEPSSFP